MTLLPSFATIPATDMARFPEVGMMMVVFEDNLFLAFRSMPTVLDQSKVSRKLY